MARMVCKRAFPHAAAAWQDGSEGPTFEDWQGSGPGGGEATASLPDSGAVDDGNWFQSSRELSAGLGFSEGPWPDGPFGDAGP